MKGSDKPRGKFVPEGYKTRLEALMAVIRFGPAYLPGAPFPALLFDVERSLPYGKKSDAASLSQMTDGIKRSDGSWVRAASGLKKSAAAQANADLERKGLLKRKTKESNRGGYQPTEYTVNWKALNTFFASVGAGSDTPLVHSADKPLSDMRTTPLSVKRTYRVRESSSQSKDSQSLVVLAQGSTAGGTPKVNPKPTSDSLKVDDDNPWNPETYATPEAALRDLYVRKTGAHISLDVEQRIWETVELRGATRKEYVERLQSHVRNTWTNPAGFLTSFAKKVGRVATPEPARPEPAEPPKNEHGRCSLCNGFGYAAAGVHCECSMGRDLKRADERIAAKKAKEAAA